MCSPLPRLLLALLVIAVSAASACAGRLKHVVRTQAAGDMRCPEDQVAVQVHGDRGDVRAYTASGCGQKEGYQTACNSRGHCVAYPLRERRPAPPMPSVPSEDAPHEPGQAEPAEVVEEETGAEAHEAVEAAPPLAPLGAAQAVTLRNECAWTVALFLGQDPSQPGGRYMSLGSTNTATMQLRQGESVWLLDAKGAALASVLVERGVGEVAIVAGCEGLVGR